MRHAFILFFFVFSFGSLQAQWIDVGGSNTDSKYSLWFNNQNNGWVSGQYIVMRTVNAGTDWAEHSTGIRSNWDIQFISDEIGFVAGADYAVGKILKSTNGGVNWTVSKQIDGTQFYSIFFVNQEKGWAGASAGKIFYTINAGTDWTEVATPSSNIIEDIWFVNESIGFAATSHTTGCKALLKTTNGGLEWVEVNITTTNDLKAITFIDASKGWKVGTSGKILKTTDGGDSWTEQTSGTTETLIGVSFISSDVGYACGYNGTILYTQNGGDTWTAEDSGLTTLIYDIHFGTENEVYACALNGKILKKTTTPPATTATLTTTAASSITQTTAISGGNITSDGGAEVTARGVVWSKTENPTVEANAGITSNGTGTGEFVSNISNLEPNTTYYLKAYATNSEGTAYGNQITFTTLEEQGGETVTDIDGNAYSIISIGEQQWIASNLRVAKFNNGDVIPNVQSDGDWSGTDYPVKWANYNNETANDAIYGKLYDGRVAIDARNVCPEGWHVATKAEWENLISYLGGTSAAGNKLMDNSGNFWATPNEASNESGFKALPGGYRASSGTFLSLTYSADFWTSTQASTISTHYVYLHYSGSLTVSDGMTGGTGRSIRCVKDSETQATEPSVTTSSVSNVTQTSASSGGNVTDDGGAEVTVRGVVWSKIENPTVEANAGITSNGTGIGEFESSLTGLDPNTLYYVRAYATNSIGTAYGNQLSFTTLQEETEGLPLPFNEGFEGSTFPPEGWASYIGTNGLGTEQNWFRLSSSEAHSGNACAAINFEDVTGGKAEDWLVTPKIKLNSSKNRLSYFEKQSYGTDYGGQFKVKVSTTNQTDHNSFTDILSYTESSFGTTWSKRVIDLDGYASENVYIAFVYINDDGDNWLIDDISVYQEQVVAPVGAFTANTSVGYVPLSVNFTDQSTNNPETWSWDFGDGNTSTQKNPSHVYSNTGSFTVTLTVTNQGGSNTVTKNNYITVNPIVTPTVLTSAVTAITQTTASSGGNVTNNGGADVNARGVVWGVTQNPTLENNSGSTSNGTGNGTYASAITSLTAATTYYVRAYATNSVGTSYGNQVTFNTVSTSAYFDSFGVLSTFPNPFDGELNIKSDVALKSVSVININGQIIMNVDLNGEFNLSLDATNLSSGFYIIKAVGINGDTAKIKVLKN